MLRRRLEEVMRRNPRPIIAMVALIAVAVTAPLLFLKSPAPDTPLAAAPAPAAAPAGELPARAKQLLATTGDAREDTSRRLQRRPGDPFQPPSSQATGTSDRSPDKSVEGKPAAPGTPGAPVPVVITNADGTQPAKAAKPAKAARTAPRARHGGRTTGDRGTTTVTKRAVTVDVRFGERLPGRFERAIARRQAFVAGGRVIAIFVKYSPRRDKAVFAIAPSTLVTGDVRCRRKQDLCRYVDIAADKHVRLTTLAADGSLVSRRLDVMRIGRRPSSRETAAAARSAPADGACLLGRLLALSARDLPLAGDACRG